MKSFPLISCLFLDLYNSKEFISYYRDSKLEIFTSPTYAKSLELAYSQALTEHKINRQWVRSRGRQARRHFKRSLPHLGWGVESDKPHPRYAQVPSVIHSLLVLKEILRIYYASIISLSTKHSSFIVICQHLSHDAVLVGKLVSCA